MIPSQPEKNLLKVSKITLEQRPNGLCSSVISLTLNMYLPAGLWKNLFKASEVTLEQWSFTMPYTVPHIPV